MNIAFTLLPKQPAAPRLRSWRARTSAAVWRALEESGQARARRHLLDFADRCEPSQPELAKELRIAAGHTPLD
jgi:hypothetical protein